MIFVWKTGTRIEKLDTTVFTSLSPWVIELFHSLLHVQRSVLGCEIRPIKGQRRPEPLR